MEETGSEDDETAVEYNNGEGGDRWGSALARAGLADVFDGLADCDG